VPHKKEHVNEVDWASSPAMIAGNGGTGALGMISFQHLNEDSTGKLSMTAPSKDGHRTRSGELLRGGELLPSCRDDLETMI
jgi:hypothetical protein